VVEMTIGLQQLLNVLHNVSTVSNQNVLFIIPYNHTLNFDIMSCFYVAVVGV